MTDNFRAASGIIDGVLSSENNEKQELGRRFAHALGFVPGPRGPDDGVDGTLNSGGRLVHFQCKLRSVPLDRDEARRYYSDIIFHQADASVMLSGSGYKKEFKQRLFRHSGIESVNIHLLCLEDILSETDTFMTAIADIPELANLRDVNWKTYR